uniref:Uncharacterized protein n=1 Tax=Tetradesmus obliquus TaxID=3088 RepID=A0A383VRK6_TETOB|eukprot:jgi/Sobl393_1/6161/SZX67543.1
MVNSALAGAKFLGNSFDKSKGTTAPPADLMQQHNRPSLYGFRSMHAGELFLIIRQLLKASLPSDFWECAAAAAAAWSLVGFCLEFDAYFHAAGEASMGP